MLRGCLQAVDQDVPESLTGGGRGPSMQVRCMVAGRAQPLTTPSNIGHWLSSGHTIQEKGRAGERAQERSHSPFITNLRKEPMVAQLVKNPPAFFLSGFDPWVGKIPWRRDTLPTPVFLGFPGGSAGKESAHNTGDLGLIPGLGRSPGEGKGYPLQYSGLRDFHILCSRRESVNPAHIPGERVQSVNIQRQESLGAI